MVAHLTPWPPAMAIEPPREPGGDQPRPDLHPARRGVDPQEYPQATEGAYEHAQEVGRAIAREWADSPMADGIGDARRVAAECAQGLIAGFLQERARIRKDTPTPRGYNIGAGPSGDRA